MKTFLQCNLLSDYTLEQFHQILQQRGLNVVAYNRPMMPGISLRRVFDSATLHNPLDPKSVKIIGPVFFG